MLARRKLGNKFVAGGSRLAYWGGPSANVKMSCSNDHTPPCKSAEIRTAREACSISNYPVAGVFGRPQIGVFHIGFAAEGLLHSEQAQRLAERLRHTERPLRFPAPSIFHSMVPPDSDANRRPIRFVLWAQFQFKTRPAAERNALSSVFLKWPQAGQFVETAAKLWKMEGIFSRDLIRQRPNDRRSRVRRHHRAGPLGNGLAPPCTRCSRTPPKTLILLANLRHKRLVWPNLMNGLAARLGPRPRGPTELEQWQSRPK